MHCSRLGLALPELRSVVIVELRGVMVFVSGLGTPSPTAIPLRWPTAMTDGTPDAAR